MESFLTVSSDIRCGLPPPCMPADYMLVLIGFAIAANRAMKAWKCRAFSEHCGNGCEKLDGMINNVMGRNAVKFANYIGTIFILF